MLKFFRWFIGYVSFSFSEGFCDGFINDCYEKKFNLKNISVKDNKVYAECPAALYPYLRKAARKNGGRLNIIKKHGLLFLLSKIKNRWGIFTGIVAGIIFLSFVSGFIWNIEITGNKKISDTELVNLMSENGFKEGVRWKDTDRNRIENLILATYKDCAFAHINRDGVKAVLEIDEAVVKPKTVSRKKITNLKAKKSGVIVKATVYDGWAKVKKGDAVTKGDLLISGIYSGEKKVTLYTHARGEYIAQVKEKVKLTVNRTQSYKRYLTSQKRKSLLFFGLKIPLYIGKTPKNAETKTEYNYIKLNEKNLPIGICKATVKTFKREEKTLSDRELIYLTNSEINKFIKENFKNKTIVKKKIKTELKENCSTVNGYILCLEDIGKEYRIKIPNCVRFIPK